MAVFRSLIKDLTKKDYEAVKSSLLDTGAEKTIFLLEWIRHNDGTDAEIVEVLGGNTAGYYALRHRLTKRIDDYLRNKSDTPITNLVKRVAEVDQLLFRKTRKEAISLLKHLEKELIDFDLSNELTIVYKGLKKLHINQPDFFQYSQLYNKHIAYNLARDKAEELLAEYFKKFGEYTLSGSLDDRSSLSFLVDEMNNVCRLYKSHRLFVLNSCMILFHRFYVESLDAMDEEIDWESSEDILAKMGGTITQYKNDTVYAHIELIYEFLQYSFYTRHNLHRNANSYYGNINKNSVKLLSNYTLYTFPSSFLILKLQRAVRQGKEAEYMREAKKRYKDLKLDPYDIPAQYIFYMYRFVLHFNIAQYDEAYKWLIKTLEILDWHKHPLAVLETKTLQYIMFIYRKDASLLRQIDSAILRIMRLSAVENTVVASFFQRILKSGRKSKIKKTESLKQLISELNSLEVNYFSPLKFIKLDEYFIHCVVTAPRFRK